MLSRNLDDKIWNCEIKAKWPALYVEFTEVFTGYKRCQCMTCDENVVTDFKNCKLTQICTLIINVDAKPL